MAHRSEYADILRDTLSTLALIPVAGLHAAGFWVRESAERTSRLGTDLIASAAFGRATAAGRLRGTPDPTADVLARDVLAAARTYVRSVVRLPADSALYFTGELERRVDALLQQIQPDAAVDLPSYADRELEGLLREFDRLALVVRAEEHATPRRRRRRVLAGRRTLADEIDGVRTSLANVRRALRGVPARPRRGAAARRLAGLNAQKARTTLQDALREAETLVPTQTATLDRLRRVVRDLGRLAERQLTS